MKGGQIDFLVNGDKANEYNVMSRGFSPSSVMSIEDTESQSLEAIGHESNNQTEIECRVMNTPDEPQIVYSDKVLLLIQGMFDHNDLLLTACKLLLIWSLVFNH